MRSHLCHFFAAFGTCSVVVDSSFHPVEVQGVDV